MRVYSYCRQCFSAMKKLLIIIVATGLATCTRMQDKSDTRTMNSGAILNGGRVALNHVTCISIKFDSFAFRMAENSTLWRATCLVTPVQK